MASKNFQVTHLLHRVKEQDIFPKQVSMSHYLLTWNCKHLASGRVRKILETLNKQLNFITPVICTPEELMEV